VVSTVRADDSVPVRDGSAQVRRNAMPRWDLCRLAGREHADVGSELGRIDLDYRVTFLAQYRGSLPAPVRGDLHERDPNPQVLNVRDDAGQVFLCAHDDGIGDGVIMGESG